ncbi:MAG: plastocyanin/azurin family copper-binding protein [Acidobacteriota bacterium]
MYDAPVRRALRSRALIGWLLVAWFDPGSLWSESFRIEPIPHQMLFDRREIVVEAGSEVELLFVNTDVMPHNLAVLSPASLQIVGPRQDVLEAEGGSRDALHGALESAEEVLAVTRELAPGETATLRFSAPDLEGSFSFACIVRGHWATMNGTLRVVAALSAEDRELNASPPLRTVDPPMRSFVREWTAAELEPVLAPLDRGQPPSSAEWVVGRGLYRDLGCEKCHDRFGAGDELLGPSFGDLWRRHSVAEALGHVLDPSSYVADRYRTTLIETLDGRFYSGVVVSSDAEAVRLRANPLDPEEILTLSREEIEVEEPSPLSPMPGDLLSTLSAEEVLALFGYLLFEE